MKKTLLLLICILGIFVSSCATYQTSIIDRRNAVMYAHLAKYKQQTPVYSKTLKRHLCIDSVMRVNSYSQVFYYVSDPLNGAQFEDVLEKTLIIE